MARKQSSEPEAVKRDWRTPARYVFASLTVILLAVPAAVIYHRVDGHLAGDPRFRFAAASEGGEQNPNLQIEGVVYTPRTRVLDAFTSDFDRSIYLMPLAERRRNLLAIDWVKDATVSREWPGRLVVRIEERTPAAFVQLPAAGGSFHMALIDIDGVILEPPERARFSLPVLTGMRKEQTETARRERVRRALRLVAEVGRLAGDVSEIDVADAENLKVTQQMDGRGVVLFLGNRNFLARLQNFLTHYQEVHKRLPSAVTFDLRLDDRITAVAEGSRRG